MNDADRCFYCDRPAVKTSWVAGVGTIGDCGRAHTLRAERGARVGRNDPCPCGSGKKYKRCCGGPNRNDDAKPDPQPGPTSTTGLT